MMIVQPDWITPEIISTSIEATRQKKSLPALPLLRHERFDEGQSVQRSYAPGGSYDAEGPVLAQLYDDYLPGHGSSAAYGGRVSSNPSGGQAHPTG